MALIQLKQKMSGQCLLTLISRVSSHRHSPNSLIDSLLKVYCNLSLYKTLFNICMSNLMVLGRILSSVGCDSVSESLFVEHGKVINCAFVYMANCKGLETLL